MNGQLQIIGNTETRTKADARERMQQWFDQTETIEWKPWSIYALKKNILTQIWYYCSFN